MNVKEDDPMSAFLGDIEDRTEDNRDFRRVIYTGAHMQLVVMSLLPDEDIGEEVHEHTDQFFRVEEGKGEIWIGGQATRIESDMAMYVPAGARHNIRNTGHKPLKLYTLYAPPQHAAGTVHRTKVEWETRNPTSSLEPVGFSVAPPGIEPGLS